jgi:hypothetical protein
MSGTQSIDISHGDPSYDDDFEADGDANSSGYGDSALGSSGPVAHQPVTSPPGLGVPVAEGLEPCGRRQRRPQQPAVAAASQPGQAAKRAA